MKLSHSTTIHTNYVQNNTAPTVPNNKSLEQTDNVEYAVEKRVAQPVDLESKESKDSKEMNEQDLLDIQNRAIEQANKSLKTYNRVIERAVHPVTHTLMYTVKDEKTNEVIAEFPPRKIQDMVAKMWEMAGLVVDAKV